MVAVDSCKNFVRTLMCLKTFHRTAKVLLLSHVRIGFGIFIFNIFQLEKLINIPKEQDEFYICIGGRKLIFFICASLLWVYET